MKFPIGSVVRVNCPGSRWHGDEGKVVDHKGSDTLGPYRIDFNGAVSSWLEELLEEPLEKEPQHISAVVPSTGQVAEGGEAMRLYQTEPVDTDEETTGTEETETEGEGGDES